MQTTVRTDDGLKLMLREWPNQHARGTVLLIHGLGEHMGRYPHVAEKLVSGGWRVVAYDQRGHGLSEGERGQIERPDDLLRDLAAVIDVVQAEGRQPIVLLGHSMGGLVAARFVAGGHAAERPVDALVLSSPALDPGMSGFQKMLLEVLGRIAPGLAVGNGLKPEWISRDPAVVAAYRADSLVHDRAGVRLVRFIVDAGEHVRAAAPRWTVPTLLLYAGSDRCVAPAGSAAFAQAAPQAVLTVQEFAPLFHEIFNEPEKLEVFSALGGWLARLKTAS